MSEPTHDRRPATTCAAGRTADDLLEDPRVVSIVEEYLAELERGGKPDRAAYLSRYPELEAPLAQCLDGLDLVRAEVATTTQRSSRKPAPAMPQEAELPTRPLGDFQIVRELARGGMGIVYEAIQLSLGRRVALKVLPFAGTLDARQLERFKNEAQAAASLHHAHIVPVFAVGCDRGVHYYAMQLIQGQSLAALIKQLREQAGLAQSADADGSAAVKSSYLLGGDSRAEAGRAAPGPSARTSRSTVPRLHAEISTQHAGRQARFYQTAAQLMLQAAQALAHAHALGIVHRDIKPANLLIDVDGHLWVTDFGLAQFHADASLTRTGDMPGTVRYMSPEQASGQRAPLDQRTDVYSLGATFYEFLALRPIFTGPSLQSILHGILHTEPRPLRQIDRAIPVELETIILKAVSKNPIERYASAEELAADLTRYLENKPILARRPTLVDRARKWSRRHPSVVITGVLLLAVVAVLLLISNHQEKLRANEAEQRFQQARRAVDVLIEVSEDELAENPALQWTRQRILGIALGYYQDFVEQRQGDPAAQEELAAVQERVKRILRELTLLQRDMHLGILDRQSVQQALALDDGQRARLADLLASRARSQDSLEAELEHLDQDARRQRIVEIAEANDRALDLILSVSQRKRLREIVLQFHGIFAFRDPEVVEALALSREQRMAIREIERETFRWFRRPDRGRGGPPPARPDRHKAVERVLALLTPDQVRVWREMTGELVDLDSFGPARPVAAAPEATNSPQPPPRGSP